MYNLPDIGFHHASRSLTDVEKRYSQIERESLGIHFAIKRFRMYIYGMKFVVKTDHKPLVSLNQLLVRLQQSSDGSLI